MNTIQTRVLLYSNGFCFKFSQENSNFTVACEMHALKKERPTSNKDRIQIAISLKLNKFQSISKRFWTLLIFRQRYNLILYKFYGFELAYPRRHYNLLNAIAVCVSQFRIGMFVFLHLVHLIYFSVCCPPLRLWHVLAKRENIYDCNERRAYKSLLMSNNCKWDCSVRLVSVSNMHETWSKSTEMVYEKTFHVFHLLIWARFDIWYENT